MKGVLCRLRTQFALQLWVAMIALVLVSMGTLWSIHMLLFEKNYVNAAVNRIQNQVVPYLETNGEMNAATIDDTLAYLSRLIGGRALIRTDDERSIRVFSIGIPGRPDASDERKIRSYIETPERVQKNENGEMRSRVVQDKDAGMLLIVSIPVKYENRATPLFLALRLSELETAQDLNRAQLFRLSVFMTFLVSLLATAIMKYFSNPVQSITDTVDRLAKGDLSATSDIRRQDELGRLSASVAKLAEALRRVNVLRKEIIGNVSHELRTPLSLITGYAEIVRDISWADERERNDNLNLIIEEANRLNEMVRDILKFSQLQSGFLEIKKAPCDLVAVTRESVDFGRRVARAVDIEIELQTFAEEIPVDMDASKMPPVLRNLINNAINHTADGATIRIHIRRDDLGTIRVEVANPGVAIPEAARSAIWERYERIQHQGDRHEGSGIGLSIVSSILSAHGFGYGVDCRDGYNIFWFSIPPTAQCAPPPRP